jgi:antitoxin YefM
VRVMREIDIRAAARNLSRLVDDVQVSGEVVMITKNGAGAAVLLSAGEFESITETIFWLSQPRIRGDVPQAEADIRSGRTFGEDEIRAEFGVPRRTR